MAKPAVITICCSAAFYKQAIEVKQQLEKLGYKVIVPSTAHRMQQTGDYEVSHYKTWLKDAGDYHRKAFLMREHFGEVETGDAVLVLNYEKHGEPNYIGGNVLMEMALAFYLRKSIFILNDIPQHSALLEEIVGMEPIVLKGKLKALHQKLSTK